MAILDPVKQRQVDEALVLNDELESLAEEGIDAMAKANAIVRAFVTPMVRKATGTSLEGIREEAHAKTVLLADVCEGDVELASALPELRAWRERVLGVARFVEGLEPMARKRIKNPETQKRVEALARDHLASAYRLAEVLGELDRG